MAHISTARKQKWILGMLLKKKSRKRIDTRGPRRRIVGRGVRRGPRRRIVGRGVRRGPRRRIVGRSLEVDRSIPGARSAGGCEGGFPLALWRAGDPLTAGPTCQPLAAYRKEKGKRRREPVSGGGTVLCTSPRRALPFSKRDAACWARGCSARSGA